ncbi:MAG: metallophosphoesterase [candidate division Zixibacteria bacterium]|nr:metallophosphoesterase [candidate division Zixibacteria bacterium]
MKASLRIVFIHLAFAVLALSLMVSILCASENQEVIRFAVIGDRTSGHVEGVFGKVLNQIERLKPEFIMSVGDYIEGHTDDSVLLDQRWTEFMEIVADIKAPIYYVPGNNDIENDIQERLYEKYASKTYYSFDYKQIHFVMIDNSRWENSKDLPQEQIEWLKKDLAKNKDAGVTMVFMHKPFWYRTIAAGESDLLHDIFTEFGVEAVFCGHFHSYFTGEFDGIKYTTVGSSGGGMNPGISGIGYHFCWVTIDNEGIHIASIDEGAVRAWNDVTVEQLRFVNKMRFDGLENSKVVVSESLTIPEQEFELFIHNFSDAVAIDDSISWKIPENWKLTPTSAIVSVAPGETQLFAFTASCEKGVFNLPVMNVGISLHENKITQLSHNLEIARQAVGIKADDIKIDGLLDEDCWSSPVTKLIDGEGGPSKTDDTEFYFAYDNENLYLAAKCYDTKMESIVANVAEHDGPIYGEDCVGYFIQINPDKPSVYQIYINPKGVVFDIKYHPGSDGYLISDKGWNGEYRIKCGQNEGFWTVEAAIPLSQFNAKYSEGNKIKLNFRRKHKRLNEAGNWQIPIDTSPKTMGILNLN